MTQHRHTIPKGANQTASVTDPDLTPYAKAADLAALTKRVAALEAPAPTPVPTPSPTVPNTEAALRAALQGSGTVQLSGDYPVSAMIYAGARNLTVLGPARIIGSGQSTLVYAVNAANLVFRNITFVGADIAQSDSNGSSLIGVGPGSTGVTFDGCTFTGSAMWTGNTQHLAYMYGDGSASVGTGTLFTGCTFDGKGMAADLVTFYHSTASAGCTIRGNTIRNVAGKGMGVQLYDHPTHGVVIDDNTFDALSIGVRHHASSGTMLTNNVFTKAVSTPWLIDGDAVNCTLGTGNVTGQ